MCDEVKESLCLIYEKSAGRYFKVILWKAPDYSWKLILLVQHASFNLLRYHIVHLMVMFIIYCSSPLPRTLAPWGRHCCQFYLRLNPKRTRPELACNRHSVDMAEWMNAMTKSDLIVLIPRQLTLNSTLEYTILFTHYKLLLLSHFSRVQLCVTP